MLQPPTSLVDHVKRFLHDSTYITVIGIVVVFITTVVNLGITLFFTWKNTKKTNFINTVTSSRIHWIGSLREKMSSFIATAIALNYAKEPIEGMSINGVKDAEQMRIELDILRYSIFLHLNPRDEPDKEIQALVLEIHNGRDVEKITRLRNITQSYFKDEWERVKDEAEKGRLRAIKGRLKN